MSQNREPKQNKPLFLIAGLIITLLMVIPYAILKEGSIFNYHDELDGELLTYILGAKHLFEGSIYQEFMGGMDKTALTMPAPGAVFLFRFFSPFAALVMMQLIGSLVGYVGTYGCVSLLTRNRIVAFFVGLCYAFLPFLPVYGLSQYGIPLLLYTCLRLKNGMERNERIPAYAYVLIYSLCSSFVLVGYGVIALLVLWGIYAAVKKEGGKHLLLSAALMFAVYLLMNHRLLEEILLRKNNMISHKTEYVYGIGSFMPYFFESFIHNREHSGDDHLFWIPLIAIACVCTFFLSSDQGEQKERFVKNRRIMLCCVCFALICSAFTALWCSPSVVALRGRMGAVGSFQASRIMWMVPCAWYICLGAAMDSLGRFVRGRGKLIARGIVVLYGLAGGLLILYHSEVKPNVMKMVKPGYQALSFEDYYGIGVMEQVKEYLESVDGRDLSEYRVASLGIDPAASLYHGFYTLDGYSNNYSLEYKHAFRRIIAPELEKSAYLKEYFDQWGNRCYLFSAEIPGYFTVQKDGFFFTDYQITKKAFRDMGGEYILSAAYILNADEIGLTLLNEIPFETEDSYYRIFIYRI